MSVRRGVHIGCSGWDYAEWAGEVYPPGVPVRHWLECYARRFTTVEVNSTFYRLITRDSTEHWVRQTPPGFTFAVKASRYLTHVKRLTDFTGIERFYEGIQPLIHARRLGPVLWQLPDDFQRDEGRLAALLEHLPEGRHAFEFRHQSWFAPEIRTMLKAHNAVLVLADHPERRFQLEDPTAHWRYLRLHHGHRGRRGNYSPSELSEWARRVHQWRASQEIYVYFNNDWEAFAPRNASDLRRQVEELASPA